MDLIEKANLSFFDFDKVNERLYKSLLVTLSSFTDGDTLKYSEKLALLEAEIRSALRASGYVKKVDEYLANFDKVGGLLIKDYKDAGLRIDNAILKNDLNTFILEKTISDLKGSGINENFVKKISDNIRVNALQGITYKEAANRLQQSIIEKPELNRYASQVATDSLNQYEGALNDTVREKFKLTKFKYIGSEKDTTRPFCSHMRGLGNRSISTEELQSILDKYCPSGVPKEGIGNGMIAGTTVSNFAQNRGGYNCRHTVRWVVE